MQGLKPMRGSFGRREGLFIEGGESKIRVGGGCLVGGFS